MSTVKIKTEPTAAAAVDVQVKLEPSLSTGGIKLEQHTSDIDTKVESDSDADSEEDEVKSENDDDEEDIDEFTITPKRQRQYICKHSECGCSFNSSSYLRIHQHEHRFQTELNMYGSTYTLTRQSLNDLWPCPIPDCTSTAKIVHSLRSYIRRCHSNTTKQQQHEQPPPKQKARYKYYFIDVDEFYVNDIRCGFLNTIGVFICYECRLVPECLLTHLQQKHGYSEKSIDNSALPESARINSNADPNINQHTSNPHLASSINQPYQLQHQDIVRGWLCVVSNCGYCGDSGQKKGDHKRYFHRGEQITTVPALVLRLCISKTHTTYFLICRIDKASGVVTNSSSRMNQHRLDYSYSGLNTQDENGDVADQNEITEASNQKRQWKCEYPDCELFFNSPKLLSAHRREHKCETVINVRGATYTLTRQSVYDRWPCPIPDCETTWKTVEVTRVHILYNHVTSLKYKRANCEDDDQNQHQIIKRRQLTIQYLKVDDFYVSGTRCGYHNTAGLFICHECKLVPDCLLTHLQEKHGYDETSVNSLILPESAVNASADPNINQHTSNPHLASAISRPKQPQHPDIVQGWLCITSDCGYCGYTKPSRNEHQYKKHRGEQLLTVPALVLRLLFGKAQTSSFLLTRLNTDITSANSVNSKSQYVSEYDGDDDGDELVLSDYSD